MFRLALAHLRRGRTPEERLALTLDAIAAAGAAQAALLCFPEAYVPGYRCLGDVIVPPPNPAFLAHALAETGRAAAQAGVAVVLGTERVTPGGPPGRPKITVAVFGPDGALLGWQDKVQLDPSEDAVYVPGDSRRVFQVGPLIFGIAICHEGFRYPETVRWAARRGAQLVLHPHLSEFEGGDASFHHGAMLCRAAENTCYFASVNCASTDSPTTSVVVRPDGTLLAEQPRGQQGLLLADLDLAAATGLLARRYREA